MLLFLMNVSIKLSQLNSLLSQIMSLSIPLITFNLTTLTIWSYFIFWNIFSPQLQLLDILCKEFWLNGSCLQTMYRVQSSLYYVTCFLPTSTIYFYSLYSTLDCTSRLPLQDFTLKSTLKRNMRWKTCFQQLCKHRHDTNTVCGSM